MKWGRSVGTVFREAVSSAAASPVSSIATIIMVAGMCAAVLLTTGRTVGAEQAVIGSIDSAGTRSIIVRAESDSGLNTSVLDRLAEVNGIEWIAAFGAAEDVTNAAVAGGVRVPVRKVWAGDLGFIGINTEQGLSNVTAWGSPLALEQLGMPDNVGAVAAPTGQSYAVAAAVAVPDYLTFLEPVLVVPQTRDLKGEVAVLIVIAERPDLVAPLAETVRSVLALEDTTKVAITTSEELATLRALVQGQLGVFGRSLIGLVFVVTGVLVAAVLAGLVTLRRKDFGRRRALGATRSLIVGLLLTQTAILAIIGSTTGSVAATVVLLANGDPSPGAAFITAIAVLAIVVSLVAALAPALAAAQRDPIRELRVP